MDVKYMFWILGQILFYYCWSISITFFNKWCFSNFHFPLIVSFLHMTIVSHVIWLYRTVTKGTAKKDDITWTLYAKRVCPTAIAASLDIALSNWSFMYITVSMYTMCKSSTIVFILISAIIFKLEKPKLLSVVVIALISAGLFLFTYKSTSFDFWGFVLVMAASAIGGLRWVLAQILLQRDSLGLSNTLEFVYYVEPIMALSVSPLSFGLEGVDMALAPDFVLADRSAALHVLFVVLTGASLALLLTFSEYYLLSNTSSITVSICGIVKEILILGLAATVGGDVLTPVNLAGLVVCLCGISLHVYLKYRSNQRVEEAVEDTDTAPYTHGKIEADSYEMHRVSNVERRALLEDSDCSESGRTTPTKHGAINT